MVEVDFSHFMYLINTILCIVYVIKVFKVLVSRRENKHLHSIIFPSEKKEHTFKYVHFLCWSKFDSEQRHFKLLVEKVSFFFTLCRVN